MRLGGFQPRTYRVRCRSPQLVGFAVRVKETDLWCQAESDLSGVALEAVMDLRRSLEAYIAENQGFASTLTPWPADPLAPALVRAMIAAGLAAGTGPMAAVAGAIAQAVGQRLLEHSGQVVVENGGDVFLAARRRLTVALYAGPSSFGGRLGLMVEPKDMPLCLATSSATVGHSLSLGRADAATVAAGDGALADAAATMLGNKAAGRGELAQAVEWASGLRGVVAAMAVAGDKMAAWGKLKLVDLDQGA